MSPPYMGFSTYLGTVTPPIPVVHTSQQMDTGNSGDPVLTTPSKLLPSFCSASQTDCSHGLSWGPSNQMWPQMECPGDEVEPLSCSCVCPCPSADCMKIMVKHPLSPCPRHLLPGNSTDLVYENMARMGEGVTI